MELTDSFIWQYLGSDFSNKLITFQAKSAPFVITRLLLVFYYRPQTKFAKVMFLHLSVSHSVHGEGPGRGGAWLGGSAPGGCLVQGVPGLGDAWSGGCLVSGGGVPGPGGCLVRGGVETPPDGYCCGRYASYWNAFFYISVYVLITCICAQSVNFRDRFRCNQDYVIGSAL